jgi:hypothetical protein
VVVEIYRYHDLDR